MKRKIFTVFLGIASVATSLSAATVEPSIAKSAAIRFLSQHGMQTSPIKDVQLPDSLGFYAFNVGQDNGFVLVASDDNVKPILGYSKTGHFKWEELPGNATKWISGYRKQSAVTSSDSSAKVEWNNLLDGTKSNQLKAFAPAVEPLCKSNWYQLDYYNAKCPTKAGRDQAVTGCVATAMGIIMKYWNYPATGTGSVSYFDKNYGSVEADFSQSCYDWDNMPDSLDENSTQAEIDAVSTLLADCAISIVSEFGDQKEGTAAALLKSDKIPNENAEYALPNYFGYDGEKIKGIVRNHFFDNTWKLYLKNELNEGRPIIYDGALDSEGSVGHCFVCDGYDADGLFHFNWGWNGSGNGFFSIDDMTPKPGLDFSHSQEALIGITPPPSYFSADKTSADNVQVYPNPATDVLHIKHSSAIDECSLVLTNSRGQIVKNETGSESLSVTGLAPGIYMLQVISNEKAFKKQIIIK